MDIENRPRTPPATPAPSRRPLGDITNDLFPTPRRRKPPKTPSLPGPKTSAQKCAWPRFKKQVPIEKIIRATEAIFGYKPKPWQLELFQKMAEGKDTFAIAGTGTGKSLPFALLAIAAELSGTKGTVMVISPLKSLENDQMGRFNLNEIELEDGSKVKISAVAINEDNKDDSLFVQLQKQAYRICYASPECLLRNTSFKKLFRQEQFRNQLILLAVDEAHVIQEWKSDFRKDYDELCTLKIIAGSEIPWSALTATCSTETWYTIYDTIGMGRNRDFWGVDMGSDRHNLTQWIRPMEHSKRSLADLFAFIPRPEEITGPTDLAKTLFYFNSRAPARNAMRICRRLLPVEYRHLLNVYIATSSNGHKDDVLEALKSGGIRGAFATLALGMGVDISDIEQVVIYGVCPLGEMYQKGGRAARDPTMKGRIIWIVEPWVFDKPQPDMSSEEEPQKVSKKDEEDEEKRTKMNSATRDYLNCSSRNVCHREFICDHFRPKPNIPGLEIIELSDGVVVSSRVCGRDGVQREAEVPSSTDGTNDLSDDEDEWDAEQGRSKQQARTFQLTWTVHRQVLAKGAACGCSSARCSPNPDERVGQLSDRDRETISMHAATLSPSPPPPPTPTNTENLLSVSKVERTSLRDSLHSWRDAQWAIIRQTRPQLSREWILSDEDLKRIVTQVRTIVNAPTVDESLLRAISVWIPSSIALPSLIEHLQAFCTKRHQRAAEESSRRNKRVNTGRAPPATPAQGDVFGGGASGRAGAALFKVAAAPATEASPTATFTW